MVENSELAQALMNLGLTRLQAKTYLALAKLGKADSKLISKASNVIREEIYRTMPKLEKMGLVEKIIARPTLYKAVPLKEGLTLLSRKRADENAELQKQTRVVLNNLKGDDLRSTVHKESTEIIITSEPKLFRKRFEKCIQMTQSKIDVIAPLEVVARMTFNHFTCFQNALEKGVKIRVLTEQIQKKTKLQEIYELKKNRFFKLKHLSPFVPITMGLFDDKEVNIRISEEMVPSLWSNNPQIIKLASSYFSEVWNRT